MKSSRGRKCLQDQMVPEGATLFQSEVFKLVRKTSKRAAPLMPGSPTGNELRVIVATQSGSRTSFLGKTIRESRVVLWRVDPSAARGTISIIATPRSAGLGGLDGVDGGS